MDNSGRIAHLQIMIIQIERHHISGTSVKEKVGLAYLLKEHKKREILRRIRCIRAALLAIGFFAKCYD